MKALPTSPLPASEPTARLQAALAAFERSCQDVLEALDELSFRTMAASKGADAQRMREMTDAVLARAARPPK